MSKIKKTKYNANLTLDEHSDECNFYEQLSDREKEEYNNLTVNALDRRIDMYCEEISLNDFMIDRNHPDQNLYRTDSMSDLPNYRVIEDLERQVKELELKNSKLTGHFQRWVNNEISKVGK